MTRTNKMGILKKKRQLQKQKAVIGKTKTEEIIGKREYTNPLGNTYVRFFRSGKWVNDNTGCREDPDGYRILRKPNSGEIEWILKGTQSRCYRRWLKKIKKQG